MKIVQQQVTPFPDFGYDLIGIKKNIELAGRTAYKSEHKITENSYEKFFNMIHYKGHLAVAEFGTVYLYDEYDITKDNSWNASLGFKYTMNPYSIVNTLESNTSNREIYITTNMRVLIENNWLDDLKYLCSPKPGHEKRYAFKFITSRAIANEIVRHRVFSFCQESSRYCNYSINKFNNEVTFIEPSTLSLSDYCEESANKYYIEALKKSENCYLQLLAEGIKAQVARDVLPLATKTELCMCGTLNHWEKFINLRSAKDAHPDIQVLSNKVKDTLFSNK